jgi:hypothetical protein
MRDLGWMLDQRTAMGTGREASRRRFLAGSVSRRRPADGRRLPLISAKGDSRSAGVRTGQGSMAEKGSTPSVGDLASPAVVESTNRRRGYAYP